MSHNRMASKRGQLNRTMRVQDLTQPEIRAYISSLKQTYAKYDVPLRAARKAIDQSMKNESLTAILYEARKQ